MYHRASAKCVAATSGSLSFSPPCSFRRGGRSLAIRRDREVLGEKGNPRSARLPPATIEEHERLLTRGLRAQIMRPRFCMTAKVLGSRFSV